MSKEKQIEIIIDLLTDFDEMGFAPTTPCPNPEAYAIDWKNKLTKALEDCRKQSEWISVDERLPDTQQEVLTYSECNGVRSALLIVAKDDIKTWYLCTSNKLSISVTHWMPLPEAPKGGE